MKLRNVSIYSCILTVEQTLAQISGAKYIFFSKLNEMGRYKQWNRLLEWNTGLDYWTEIYK